MSKRLIFTCAKNEGPYLWEWVAYHRSIGFDEIAVFTNDCLDGTDKIADRLSELGLVHHIRNDDYSDRGPQWSAMNNPVLRKLLKDAEIALHLDIDEFLNVKVGSGQLTDLVGEVQGFDAISIPWRFFGNAGISAFVDKPVLTQFTRCGLYPVMFPRQALMFKTIFHPSEKFQKPGIHAPRLKQEVTLDDLRWLNGDGRPVSDNFDPKRPILHGSNSGNSLAQINHYALRSIDAFLIKSERGLPNRSNVQVDVGYFAARNFNQFEDTSLADRQFPIDDGSLQVLHSEACAWHREASAEIKSTLSGVELFAAISVVGDTRVPDDAEISKLYHALGQVFGATDD